MKDKTRWRPKGSADDGGYAVPVTDRAQAAAIAMAQADSAMRHVEHAMKQAEHALLAAGLPGEPDHGPAAAAMREAERLERKSVEQAQAEVERAMARASRADHRAAKAEREAE